MRYVPTPEENAKRLEAVTLDQVIGALREAGRRDARRDWRSSATSTPSRRWPLVREILKDWKSDVPVKRIDREAAPADWTGSKEDILTPDKANAVFLAGLAFPLKETDPDYAALRLGNFIFGGGTLSSRLGNRIRQKEGLSYGVTSSFTASPRDPVASFTVDASTNPANIDRVEKAVHGGAERVPHRRPDADGTGRREEGVPGGAEGRPHRRRRHRRPDRREPATWAGRSPTPPSWRSRSRR